jgi:hypothetical protein
MRPLLRRIAVTSDGSRDLSVGVLQNFIKISVKISVVKVFGVDHALLLTVACARIIFRRKGDRSWVKPPPRSGQLHRANIRW